MQLSRRPAAQSVKFVVEAVDLVSDSAQAPFPQPDFGRGHCLLLQRPFDVLAGVYVFREAVDLNLEAVDTFFDP